MWEGLKTCTTANVLGANSATRTAQATVKRGEWTPPSGSATCSELRSVKDDTVGKERIPICEAVSRTEVGKLWQHKIGGSKARDLRDCGLTRAADTVFVDEAEGSPGGRDVVGAGQKGDDCQSTLRNYHTMAWTARQECGSWNSEKRHSQNQARIPRRKDAGGNRCRE